MLLFVLFPTLGCACAQTTVARLYGALHDTTVDTTVDTRDTAAINLLSY